MSSLETQMATRREKILESARRLIESDGYDGLSMRVLAAESNVTVPTIYNLVGNKEEVFFAAVEEQTHTFVANLERAAGDLVAVVEASVRQLVRRPRYYRTLLLVFASSEGANSASRHVGRALETQLHRGVEEVSGAGDLLDLVEIEIVAQRLRAHFDMASLEWARGSLTAASFRAAALFDMASLMLGLTRGASQRNFERIVRENASDARRRGASGATKGRAA